VNDSFSTFPYAYGALQVYAAWQQGGPRGTDPLWASPPETTHGLMASVLGIGEPHESGIDIPAPDWSGDRPRSIRRFRLSASDSLGAWGLTLLMKTANADSPEELALGWRGDRLLPPKPRARIRLTAYGSSSSTARSPRRLSTRYSPA
jgi:hypothetical protein